MNARQILAAFLCVLASCAGASAARQNDRGSALEGQGGPPVNRLLVVAENGGLYTIKPDGADRRPLTDDPASNYQYRQPTWSPSAERIAWVEIETRGAEAINTLVTSRIDGGGRTQLFPPFAPFYLFWSPDSRRLAYLSNWTTAGNPTLALRLVDVTDGGDQAATLALGRPSYFSWSPDSRGLLAHIGSERLELYTLEGLQQSLAPTPAAFAAPQWSSNGQFLVYALGSGSGQRLVLADRQGRERDRVATFEGRINFNLSPADRHIAYVVTDDPRKSLAFGPLYVVDIESLQARRISADPVLGFFWSPDGAKLAYMAAEKDTSRVRLRWHVWDGEKDLAYGAFAPNQTYFRRYAPFFDQYAQSMTIWSPDSSAFTYAGETKPARRVCGCNVWEAALRPYGSATACSRLGRRVERAAPFLRGYPATRRVCVCALDPRVFLLAASCVHVHTGVEQ